MDVLTELAEKLAKKHGYHKIEIAKDYCWCGKDAKETCVSVYNAREHTFIDDVFLPEADYNNDELIEKECSRILVEHYPYQKDSRGSYDAETNSIELDPEIE